MASQPPLSYLAQLFFSYLNHSPHLTSLSNVCLPGCVTPGLSQALKQQPPTTTGATPSDEPAELGADGDGGRGAQAAGQEETHVAQREGQPPEHPAPQAQQQGAAAVVAAPAGVVNRAFAHDVVKVVPPKGNVAVNITRIIGARDAAPMVSRRQWQSAGLFPTHKIGLTRALQALASEARRPSFAGPLLSSLGPYSKDAVCLWWRCAARELASRWLEDWKR